jgi:hypothetical protein
MVRSNLILILAVLIGLGCAPRPPKPRIVYGHRKHPKKSADTVPLGPPVIREDDPVVVCARKFVRAIIDNDQGTVETMISPEWLKETDRSLDTFSISRSDLPDMPAHAPYTITDVRGNLVSVVLHRDSIRGVGLMVRVSDEHGHYHVVPSGADDCCGSIDPWYWPPEPQPRRR